MPTIQAQPYDYHFEPKQLALVIIDMQRDFLEPGGFGAALGNDVRRLAPAVPAIARLLKACRAHGISVIHTKECHRPDLSDCPPAKRERGKGTLRIGEPGPMGRILIDGEPGNDFVAELKPWPGEVVIAKPGKGAFYATSLHDELQRRGVTHLLVTGVTTEVCVQTTMREANDRGYECLLLADCCGATVQENHEAALRTIQIGGGVFGAVSDSRRLLDALAPV
jgi:nicotinamidase-related amidase